jgi:hypothetical protein
MKKGERQNSQANTTEQGPQKKNPISSLVRGDPIEERVQRRIFLQPVSGSGIFYSKIINDLFVVDGGEFLMRSLAGLFSRRPSHQNNDGNSARPRTIRNT